MDKRTPLKPGTQLNLSSTNGSERLCYIEQEIGRGSSCLVYEGYYYWSNGDKRKIRIKEFYPYKMDIERNENGELIAKDKSLFVEENNRFIDAVSKAKLISNIDGLYDTILVPYDIYDFNNTKYATYTFATKETLSTLKPEAIKECIEMVCQVAKSIKACHENGYLYLDIKPDNVLYEKNIINNRIQLFDFNSLIPYNLDTKSIAVTQDNIRLSYSRGFAAVELQQGNLKRIGPSTDVFGIGALFYYLLFGSAPTAIQCENDVRFHFNEMRFDAKEIDDKLLTSITDFFHHTLNSYCFDRYQTMAEVVDHLEIIFSLADPIKKRIIFSPLHTDVKFVGREDEIKEIDRCLNTEGCRSILISGIAGIGKSTIIREYFYGKKDKYECVLLSFHDSIKATIIDDDIFQIHGVNRDKFESENEYYSRKIREVKPLVTNNTVLVIDNFSGNLDRDYVRLLELNWKIIIISRNKYELAGSLKIEINRITDEKVLVSLFQKNLGKTLSEKDEPHVQELIRCIDGHTLMLELLAKQISCSHINIEEAVDLVKRYSVSGVGIERVDFEKDGVVNSDTIGNIIDELFSTNNLSQEKRFILKALSILVIKKLSLKEFVEILELSSYQDLNELDQEGWISFIDEEISMHPVIREAVLRWPWNNEFVDLMRRIMSYLIINIKIEATRNDYPRDKRDMASSINRYMQMISNPSNSNILDKFILEIYERQVEEEGIIGQIYKSRIERITDDSPADIQWLSRLLAQARELLPQYRNIHESNLNVEYYLLLYLTIQYSPVYSTEYTYIETSNSVENYKDRFLMDGIEELLTAKNKRRIFRKNKVLDSLSMVFLMKNAMCLYANNGEYERAEELINIAKIEVEKNKKQIEQYYYYDLISRYYEIKIAGAYDISSDGLYELKKLLRDSIEKRMSYSPKNTPYYYYDSVLSYVYYQISSGDYIADDLGNQLDDIKEWLISNTQQYDSIRIKYYVVRAWYYASILKDYPKAGAYILFAIQEFENNCPNELAKLDDLYLPSAKVFISIGSYKDALRILLKAFHTCRRYNHITVYVKRYLEVVGLMTDVALAIDNIELAQMSIELIDNYNSRFASKGIHKDVPEGIRERIIERNK